MATLRERALVQRIKRRLARDGSRLRKTRGRMMRSNFGDWHIVDHRNNIIGDHINLELVGRELGVLTANERLGQ